MQPTNTRSTLRYLQNKIRLIRAIHLYKLKFEELSAEEERSTRLELSNYDLLQEEMEEHSLALTAMLHVLSQGNPQSENQKLIREILSQLPQITREMHLFVKSLDAHSQNIQQWLKTITPEIPQKNIHLYRRSTATSQKNSTAVSHKGSTTSSQANNQKESPQKSKDEEKKKILESFTQYAQTLQLLRSSKQNIQFTFSIENFL